MMLPPVHVRETYASAVLTVTLIYVVMVDPCTFRASPVGVAALMFLMGLCLAICNYNVAMSMATTAALISVVYHANSCQENFTQGAPWRLAPSRFLPGHEPEPSVGSDVPSSSLSPRRVALTTDELLAAAQSNIVPRK